MQTKVSALLTPKISTAKISASHAKITFDPLERGFGRTLGNALRRVLLSSIVGSAITRVEIDNVAHEYDRLPGVSEDLIDVLLNLKGVAIHMHGIDEAVLTLTVTGPGDICAGDIQMIQNVSVANPKHHIAHIDDDSTIAARLTVHRGRGYMPASMLSQHQQEASRVIGSLRIDASFSPVRRVAYDVQSTRVEQRTDMDKLILDIETNGAITPYDAVREAGNILRQQISAFADMGDGDSIQAAPPPDDDAQATASDRFAMPVTDLGLGTRAVNCLLEQGIESVGDLVVCSPGYLLKTPNLGKQMLAEITARLKDRSLSLGMELDAKVHASVVVD